MTHPCPSLAKWFISNVILISNEMLLMQCRWYPTSIWPFPFKVKQKLLDLFIWAWPASSEVADSYRCPYNHYIPSRYCCNPMAVAERWLWYYTVRACKHVSSTGIKLSKVVLSHRDTVSEAQTLGMRWDVLHMYWSYWPLGSMMRPGVNKLKVQICTCHGGGSRILTITQLHSCARVLGQRQLSI